MSPVTPSQTDLENAAFLQDKREVLGLQRQKRIGPLSSEASQRLGMLQAKMDDFWGRKMETARRRPSPLEVLARAAGAPEARSSAVSPRSAGLSSASDRTVQRLLSTTDAQALESWCKDQGIRLDGASALEIPARATDLPEAKQMALDAAARSASTSRAKVMAGALARTRSRKTPEEIQSIETVLEDLQRGGLGRALPAAIASLAELLMDTYPPAEYSYVLMGNSPAPLLAWLQLNGRQASAFHLPLGGLTTPEGTKKMAEVGAAAVQDTVSGYLDSALELAVARRKPLVLIDYVSSGGSLAVTAGFIKRWLASRGIDLSVDVFGFSERAPEAVPELMESGHRGVLATAVGEMERAFTRMNADKIFKNVLLLKGPASLDIVDLLNAPNPAAAVVEHPDHWARLLRLMRNELLYD